MMVTWNDQVAVMVHVGKVVEGQMDVVAQALVLQEEVVEVAVADIQ